MFAEPVELPVAVPSLDLEQILEHLAILLVVRPVEKVETAHILQVFGELVRMALAQHLDGRGSLGVAYFLVPLLKRVGLEALPRQRAAQKVHEHVAERLEVVASTLLLAQMCVDAHVARGARQALVLSVRYVLISFWVYVGFGEAEVNYMYNVLAPGRVPAD